MEKADNEASDQGLTETKKRRNREIKVLKILSNFMERPLVVSGIVTSLAAGLIWLVTCCSVPAAV